MIKEILRFFRRIKKGRYTSDLSSQSIYFILRTIGGVLIGAYVARYLGPGNLGIMGLLIAVGTLVTPFIELGSRQILIKDFSQKTKKRESTFWTLFFLKILVAVPVVVALFFILTLGWVKGLENESWLLVGVGISVVFFTPLTQFRCLLIAETLSKATVRLDIFVLVLSIGAKALSIYLEVSLLGFVLINILTSITSLLIPVWAVFQKKLMPSWTGLNFVGVRKILSQSWPLMLSGIAIVIYTRSDVLMVSHFLSNRDVGIFTQAVKLFELLFFFPAAVHVSLSPKIYQLLDNKNLEMSRVVSNAFVGYGLIAILIVIPSILCAPLVIPFLYGKEFQDSILIFIILVISLPAYGLGLARDYFLIHKGYTRFSLVATCIGCVSNLGLNFLLIPKIGIVGAAVSSLICYYISSVLSSVFLAEKSIFWNQLKAIFPLPHRVFAAYKEIFLVNDLATCGNKK